MRLKVDDLGQEPFFLDDNAVNAEALNLHDVAPGQLLLCLARHRRCLPALALRLDVTLLLRLAISAFNRLFSASSEAANARSWASLLPGFAVSIGDLPVAIAVDDAMILQAWNFDIEDHRRQTALDQL